MASVLITGVAGFIASHVARRFAEQGNHVIGVDDLSSGARANIPGEIEFIEGDLAQRATIARIPAGCRTILHLAGQSSGEISFDDPVADLQKNTITTLNLIRYAIDNRAERLVYASSMSVYGPTEDHPVAEDHPCAPLSCYGVSKLAAENYLRVYRQQVPSVSLRMFNVYGPGQDMTNLRQGMVSIYLAQAIDTGRIEIKGNLDRFRDFVYIDDVVEAWWRVATRPEALGKTLNIATGVRTSVGELVKQVCASVEGSTYLVRGSTPGDQNGIYADTTQLRGLLRIGRFTPLAEGLAKFVAWARDRL